jgi:hypothetical protein
MQVGMVSDICFHVNDTRSFLATLYSHLDGSTDGQTNGSTDLTQSVYEPTTQRLILRGKVVSYEKK